MWLITIWQRYFKAIVHPKNNKKLAFTHPHVVSNLNDFFQTQKKFVWKLGFFFPWKQNETRSIKLQNY